MRNSRKIIYLASFIFALPVALTSYINSSFLGNFFPASQISALYVIASLITIFAMLKLPRALERLGNKKTSSLISLLVFVSFIIMALSSSAAFVALAFILNVTGIILLYETLDIFIEDFSKVGRIGSFRGFYLSITNLAWIVAQLFSSKVILGTSFIGIYLLAAILMLLVYLIFRFSLSSFRDPKYQDRSFIRGVKFFVKNKNFGRIYIINLILRFFYSWMVIYTPIYLHQNLGFDWAQIGMIFSIMLVPFVFQYPLGKLSDKIGEKSMLKIGFLIAAISTLIIPQITDNTVLVWAGILFATRVGAATIEVMSENYFFKSVKEENVEALSFFRNTAPISDILGPILGLLVITLAPLFSYLFYILGAVLLLGFLLSTKLREVK